MNKDNKLNKSTILKILKEDNLDPKRYIILSGASLVLQDIKEYTSDIDIAVDNTLCNEILNKYSCTFEKYKDGYKIWYIDNIINFSNNLYTTTKYIEIYGYKAQSLDSILELKRTLNRQKDKKDISLILDYKNNLSIQEKIKN